MQCRILTHSLIFMLLALGLPVNAAEDSDWYQVELIIFKELATSNQREELWRDQFDLIYPDNAHILKIYQPPPVEEEIIEDESAISESVGLPGNRFSEFPDAVTTPDEQSEQAVENGLNDPYRAEGDTGIEANAGSDAEGFADFSYLLAGNSPQPQPVQPMNLARDPYILLPEDNLSLNQAARRLERSADFQVLAHIGWRQPARSSQQTAPVVIQVGKQQGLAFEVEGLVSLSENRFQHIALDLYYSEFEAGQTVNLQGLNWSSLLSESEPATSGMVLTSPAFSSGNQFNGLSGGLLTNRSRVAKITHSRRINPDEVNYIDHPLFGALVKITAYQVPDAVLEMDEIDIEQLPDPKSLPAGLSSPTSQQNFSQ